VARFPQSAGGGAGWPGVNGTGAGNLTAETGSGDTVGYILADSGSGGIHLGSEGTGSITVQTGGTGALGVTFDLGANDTAPFLVSVAGNGGIEFIDDGTGGILIEETGTGAITIETTGGGASTGIALTAQATDTGGIVLTNNSSVGSITLDAVAGLIKLLGVPTTDPGVSGALFTTAGVLHISP
jgi:hypothetical protein